MNKDIVLFHEKALNKNFPGSDKISERTKQLFIWDDQYFKRRGYTLKRLVFIYETLCQMNIEIIQGDTLEVIQLLSPKQITTFFTTDLQIKEILTHLASLYPVKIIKPDPFVIIPDSYDSKRFFQYWNQARKTAFRN